MQFGLLCPADSQGREGAWALAQAVEGEAGGAGG